MISERRFVSSDEDLELPDMPPVPEPPAAVTDPFHFGARVEFTHLLERKMVRPDRGSSVENKIWRPKPHLGWGLLIGKRTLADGKRTWEYEIGWEFTPSKHFAAYLVAQDMHLNPVYVLPEHLRTDRP